MPPNQNHDAQAQLRDAVERIARKIENSPALNGGWDKMVVSIEHIKEKQDETCEKVDAIQSALYEPDDGFFARVKSIESDAKSMEKKLQKSESENEKSKEVIEITQKLLAIAGKELEDLNAVIKLRKNFDKLFWLIAAGTCSVVGKMIWDIISTHH